MSATEKVKNKLAHIETLGIIAGGGRLPFMLLDACHKKNITPYILAFKGHTDPALVDGINHVWTSLGALQKNIDALKSAGANDLVFCGSIRKPSFLSLKPDMRATKFLLRNGYKALGDNSLLTAIKAELQKDDLTFHGVHDVIDDILTPSGVLGRVKPTEAQRRDISYGFKVSQDHGQQDLGQSVIVEDGETLAVETEEGTDALIRSVTSGILVKTCKPQQDRDLDLPTIGLETVEAVFKAGLSGIAIHAGHSLLLERDAVIDAADKAGIFVYGVSA